MNIAVVDDASADRTQLLDTIQNCAKENTIMVRLTEYESGEAFLEKVHPASLDALFLDIYMGELSGMDVAYKIRQLNPTCRIIFVTTSAAFAVQSYNVRAFYYILKPYTHEDIANVLNMLDKSLQKSSRYIKVKEGREWCKILLSDIIYVDCSNHYVQIHTENSITSTYMKFPEIEEQLLAYDEFLSCYRCIMVNMNKIKKVDDLFFLMCSGEYIPINRKRAKAIKARYVDYIFKVIEQGDKNDN